MLVALGESRPSEWVGDVEIRFVPLTLDLERVAKHYQAADVYVHAAREETFPNSVIEALACGTPVVATAVGGIVEQVKSLSTGPQSSWTTNDPDSATGVLTDPLDAVAIAHAIRSLLADGELRAKLAGNAALDARSRFDLSMQARKYVDLYRTMLSDGDAQLNEKTGSHQNSV